MRVEVVRGFLSAAECAHLNAAASAYEAAGAMVPGISRGKFGYALRKTTRPSVTLVHDAVTLQLRDRIRKCCGVQAYPLLDGHGSEGIVVSKTFAGGDVYRHRDPFGAAGAALRCNVVTQAPTAGGHLYVGDRHIHLDAGDLHCYLASEFFHYVTPVEGDTPRILWMFGAYVPASDWESGLIKMRVQ